MKASQNGYNIIKKFEGCKLSAYLDSVGVPTIGYGNTFYQTGQKVRLGDRINQSMADALLQITVDRFAEKVYQMLKVAINQNQFDALISFSYNVGLENLAQSTLLKRVNINPSDPTISYEFGKWNKAGGKILKGLTIRRDQESSLYFK